MSVRAFPKLLVVTDHTLDFEILLKRVSAVCAELKSEVGVQYRNPTASARRFFEEARRLMAICGEHDVPFFVNGRLDVALLLAAHLHLPSHGLLVEEVRSVLPGDRWISCAVHNFHEARQSQGADLVLVSPVFPPLSKPNDTRATLGAAGFEKLANAFGCPAYALGGVTSKNRHVLPASAGVATIGAVLHAPDPVLAAWELLSSASKLGPGNQGSSRDVVS